MSPRNTFLQELEVLKISVSEMGNHVSDLYHELFEALENGEKEEIIRILKSDRNVNDMEKRIESECLSLLTRQQPLARDLRLVSAALKAVTDMERMGDHVSDMAELLLRLELPNLSEFSDSLENMIRTTENSMKESVEAFVNGNLEDAQEVIQADDIIDDLFNQVKEDLICMIKEESKNPDACVDVLMLAKYLEKIGDHAVNIGEWAMFQKTGNIEDVRIL